MFVNSEIIQYIKLPPCPLHSYHLGFQPSLPHFCSISNASLLSPCQKLNSLKTGHRSCLQHIHKATQTTVFLTKVSVVPTSTALSVAPSWPPSTPHNGPPFQAPSLRRVSSPAAIRYLLQDCWDRCGTVTASGQLSPDSPQRGSDKVQSP